MRGASSLPWVEPLGERELEILRLLADGLSNRQIGDRLGLSVGTVKWYNKQLFAKLGVSSRARAVAVASEHGLLEPPAGPSSDQPRRDNLPAPVTSFVPRPGEEEDIQALLKTSRLVVLTGAAGTGKTRLALHVASELRRAYQDGAWLVELAAVGQPDQVAETVRRVLGVDFPGASSPLAALKGFLRRKHLLLVLDNFEHLLDAAPLVGEILSAAPSVTVLATSREPLGIYGEQEYPVEPLPLPSEGTDDALEQLLLNPAVDLFLQRARAVRPSLPIDPDQGRAAARICRRLDGLPLAIELAASQVGVFLPTSLAERITVDPLGIPGGRRDGPARHRTLQAAIDWSYDLLDDDEKTLFRRFSVFRGGAPLESIEPVCLWGSSADPVRLVSSLVAKHLLQSRENPPDQPRFSMLATIREYAAARLERKGETDPTRKAHASHFADLAEQADGEFRGPRNSYWMLRLGSEHPNLEAALEYALAEPEPMDGLRLAAFLDGHWYFNGFATEGRRWTSLARQRFPTAPAPVRARLLRTIGNVAYALNDQDQSRRSFAEAGTLYRALEDPVGAAWCDAALSMANIDIEDGLQRGIRLAEDALRAFRLVGHRPGEAFSLNVLGELARLQGEYARAKTYYEQCLAIAQQTGETIREAMQYENLGVLAYHRGEYHLSGQLVRHALALTRGLGTTYGLATALATLAGPEAALGRPRRAARLLGAANAHLQALGTDHQPADQPDLRRFLKRVVEDLGEDEFQLEWEMGRTMTVREATQWVLGEKPGPTADET